MKKSNIVIQQWKVGDKKDNILPNCGLYTLQYFNRNLQTIGYNILI